MKEIQSYRQMPAIVYHFQSKGRDETRARAGLLRVREFVMKDAYSFDVDQAGLEKSYAAEHRAYARTFERMGLDAISVESDTGAMGGDVAHEFQVLNEAGEDRIAICTNCDYKANLEKATRKIAAKASADGASPATPISTPGATTIDDLERTLRLPASAFLKTLLLRSKDGVVAIVLPGDRAANEPKLRKLLDVANLEFANDADFATVGGVAGFVGPIGLRNARVLVDVSVETRPYVAGANKKDTHRRDGVPGRDFSGGSGDVPAELETTGLEVLYDDRDESAGVKFADADLIGIPLRMTVSKRNLKEGKVEIKGRSSADLELVPLSEGLARVRAIVAAWPR